MHAIVMEIILKGRDKETCLGLNMGIYDFTNICRGTFSKLMRLV